jgi:hypothetical protein
MIVSSWLCETIRFRNLAVIHTLSSFGEVKNCEKTRPYNADGRFRVFLFRRTEER